MSDLKAIVIDFLKKGATRGQTKAYLSNILLSSNNIRGIRETREVLSTRSDEVLDEIPPELFKES